MTEGRRESQPPSHQLRARTVGLGFMVLTAALVLSGCLQADDAGDGPTGVPVADPSTAEPPAFDLAQPMPQDGRAAEPNIAIAGDGTVYVVANGASSFHPNAVQGASWLWRSTDGGQRWDTLRSPDPAGAGVPLTPWGTGDADVVTGPDGWVYYTDWWVVNQPVLSGPHGNFIVEASADMGDTWTHRSPVTAQDSDPNDLDRQWLVAGEDGLVGLFYQDDTPEPPGSGIHRHIDAAWSTDHGLSWSQPEAVVPAEEGRKYKIGHPQPAADGTLVLPYGRVPAEDDASGPAQVMVAVSDDQGANWEHVKVADVPEGIASGLGVQGAVDGAGNMFVAWPAWSNDTTELLVSESVDGGQTWSKAHTVRGVGLNVMPWVAATGDGRVAVAWYASNATGTPAEVDGETPWYAYVAERTNASAAWRIAKVDPRPVEYGGLCADTPCPEGTRTLLDYLSLAYAPTGQLHVVFARSQSVTEDPWEATVYHAVEVGNDGELYHRAVSGP